MRSRDKKSGEDGNKVERERGKQKAWVRWEREAA